MSDDDTPAAKPKLLDQVRNAIRRKHYSLRTEDTRYNLFPNLHPLAGAIRAVGGI